MDSYETVNFKMYIEPDSAIRTAEEFAQTLNTWARQQARHLTILELSMEPLIELEGRRYVCRLAEPRLVRYNHSLFHGFNRHGINGTVGILGGFKWVYLYEAPEGGR